MIFIKICPSQSTLVYLESITIGMAGSLRSPQPSTVKRRRALCTLLRCFLAAQVFSCRLLGLKSTLTEGPLTKMGDCRLPPDSLGCYLGACRMHSSSAVNRSHQPAEQRTAEGAAAGWGILHFSSDLGHWPKTIHFTSVAQNDNLPLSAIHSSPYRVFSVRTEMRTAFADIPYDCGFDTQTHLHHRED